MVYCFRVTWEVPFTDDRRGQTRSIHLHCGPHSGAPKFNLEGIYLGSSFIEKISILQSSPTQIDHHSNSFVVLIIHQKILYI